LVVAVAHDDCHGSDGALSGSSPQQSRLDFLRVFGGCRSAAAPSLVLNSIVECLAVSSSSFFSPSTASQNKSRMNGHDKNSSTTPVVAAGTLGGSVVLVDSSCLVVARRSGHSGPVAAIEVAGTRVASAGPGEIFVWDRTQSSS
jgi:hypothetical protein